MLNSRAVLVCLTILLLSNGGRAQDSVVPRVLGLRECVQIALQQNPDILLARLDYRESQAQADSVADPYSLKFSVGSGLAYTTGFPMNVGGTGPSLVNAQASMTLYDRPQQYRVREARQRADAVAMGTAERERSVSMEVARLFLNAEALQQAAESGERELESRERVLRIRETQLEEGRVLPLDAKLARAETARARLQLRETRSRLAEAQARLAFVLGLDPSVPVQPAKELRDPLPAPASLSEATDRAIREHPTLERIDRQLAAARLRLQGARATHWPVIRLVSQYSMFTRFNNYDQFYARFERHNGQLGASFELPIFTGKAPRAAAEQADVETERLRVQAEATRREVTMQTANAYRNREDAQATHELAALELDAARERVSVMLARSGEGRATLLDLESARAEEARHWAEFYRTRAEAERAVLELLSHTGDLLAALR
jgi:outer membrane protein